jgi:hypothetical protein
MINFITWKYLSVLTDEHLTEQPRCGHPCYISSNGGVISECWIGKDAEGNGCGIISRQYPSTCLEGPRKPRKPSGMPVFGPIFEPGTSGIQSRSVNHSTMTISLLCYITSYMGVAAKDVTWDQNGEREKPKKHDRSVTTMMCESRNKT